MIFKLHTRFMYISLVLLLFGCPILADDNASRETLVIGFTATHFSDINRSDALAAFEVWVEAILERKNIELLTKTVIYDKVYSLNADLRTGTPDFMILSTADFLLTQKDRMLDPQYVSVRGPGIGERYLLVVERDGPMQPLDDLKECTIVFKTGARMSLAERWLNRKLTDAQLPNTQDLCGHIVKEDNIPRSLTRILRTGRCMSCHRKRFQYDVRAESRDM